MQHLQYLFCSFAVVAFHPLSTFRQEFKCCRLLSNSLKRSQIKVLGTNSRWGYVNKTDVHPESWVLGDGNFASTYLKESSNADQILGEDPIAIGRALVQSRTVQERRQDADDRNKKSSIEHNGNLNPFQFEKQNTSLAMQYRTIQFDGMALGVGGMDYAIEEIRRRIWVPLSAPKEILDDLGISMVSGLLLYGPPGCGKSILARRLSGVLSPRPPTFVSGPEILDRFVGASEANIRSLFDFPPPLPAGSEDALHVIVLDEFDAIAGSRSAGAGGDGSERVRDSVVNQLLSRMDGVQQMKTPTLLIGLTNRRDLIDSALLRPGRFEVQIEINVPDKKGRIEILRIHCTKMWISGRLEIPKWSEGGFSSFLNELAEDTESFSGAELAGLVRVAASYALERCAVKGFADPNALKVMKNDFKEGLKEIRRIASQR